MHLLSKIRLAVLFCLMSVSAHAWNLPTGSYQFESIADRVYVMHGPLGEPSKDNQGFMNNPAFIESQTGLILIDPGSTLQIGKKILEEIRRITPKPVLAVFNTHIHGDHWLGNQAIRLAYPEVDIYAHADTITQANDIEGQNWLDLMLRLTEARIANNDRVAGEGTIEQVHQDMRELQALGCTHVLLDTYYDDLAATSDYEAAWRMLTKMAEKVLDLDREAVR